MSSLPRHALGWSVAALLLVVLLPDAGAQQRNFARPNSVGAQSARNMNSINPNFYLPSGTSLKQASYNTATLGNAISHVPPYALGHNPYVNSVNAITPAFGGVGVGGIAPWGFNGYGPGNQTANTLDAYGGYLRGAADLTAATGQYQKDIQSARIDREKSRQSSLDTKRKELELELEYEKYRVTAPKLRDAELRTDLDWARRFPDSTEVWSGKSLNTLLRSVQTTGTRAGTGPNIPLEEELLRGINFTTKTSRGSTGMLKDGGKLAWPDALQEAAYDDPRNRFSKSFTRVADDLNRGEAPDRATRKDLQADLDTMALVLESQVKDLSPSDYIGSRRYINQLKDTLKALADPTMARAGATRLPASVRSVGDLVSHMTRNGLEFAPAVAPGDEPSYSALYQSLRAYEASLVLASR